MEERDRGVMVGAGRPASVGEAGSSDWGEEGGRGLVARVMVVQIVLEGCVDVVLVVVAGVGVVHFAIARIYVQRTSAQGRRQEDWDISVYRRCVGQMGRRECAAGGRYRGAGCVQRLAVVTAVCTTTARK